MRKLLVSMMSIVLAVSIFAPQAIAFSGTENFYSTKTLSGHWEWTSGGTGNNFLKASDNTTSVNVNNVAFCLDNGKDAPLSSGTTGSYIGEVDNGILSVMYYGYPYRSAAALGATNDEVAYDATQLAIYAMQGTLSHGGSGIAQFSPLKDYNGNAVTVAKQIYNNAINNPYTPVKDANVSVTTHHSNITVNGNYYYVGSYTAKLNGADVSDYTVNLVQAPSGTEVVKSGANFYFRIPTSTTLKNNVLRAQVSASSSTPYLSCAMYSLGGNYQRMSKLKITTPEGAVTIDKDFPDPSGQLSILKKDNNNRLLPGTIFEIEHTTLGTKQTKVTNDQGIVTVKNLEFGTWKITEIQAPAGYDVDSTPQYVTIDDSKPIAATVTFINNERTGTLKVKKTTPGMVNLKDLVFILSGTSDSGREINIEATTDADGIATFNNVPIGTYTVNEKGSSVPYAYMTADPEEVTVQYAQTTDISISNAEKTGSIQIKKTTPGMVNLADLVFILTGTSDTGRQINIEATTDANGTANFTNVPLGTYTVSEKNSSVPYAYMTADSEEVTVQYAQTTSIDVSNAEKTGTIKITKSTRLMKDIANITFILHGTSDSGRDILLESTTDINGYASFDKIPLGTYTLTEKESTVPFGYLTAEDREVKVSYAQEIDVSIYNLEDPNIPLTNSTNNNLFIISLLCYLSLAATVGITAIRVKRKKE